MNRNQRGQLAAAVLLALLAGTACGDDGASTHPCDHVDCNGHGTCSATDGVPVCACTTGYAGPWCGTCQTGYVSCCLRRASVR